MPVTVKVKLKNGRCAGEATVKQTHFGISLPEKRASEPRVKFELKSPCGWHRKTQGGQIKLIEGWRAGGLQPAWEIHDEGSGPE